MAPAYRVALLPEARDDLDRIVGHIRQDSPPAAVKVLERLRAATESLAHLPHRFRVHRSHQTPARVVHAMVVSPYVVYYRVTESDRMVRVLTIRHGRRRQPRRFK